MFKYLSLSGLPFSDEMEITQFVSVRTGPGEQDFVNVLIGDFRTYMTELVNARIDNLGDVGGGGSGPSIWPVSRTITLSGPVAGSAAFDGSTNFTVLTSIADGALSIAKTSGLQTALDGKLNTSAYTAADVLAKLLTVDGNGSGLDADLLDGLSSRDYLNNTNIAAGGDLNPLTIQRVAFNSNNQTNAPTTGSFNYLMSTHAGGNYISTGLAMGHGGVNDVFYGFATGAAANYADRVWSWQRLWHAGNFDPTTKANTNGQAFTGPVRAPTMTVDAIAAADAYQIFRNEAGVNQAAVGWDRTTDTLRLRRYNAAGTLIEGEISLGATALSYNGNAIYHEGNLGSSAGYLAQASVVYANGAGFDCNSLVAGTKVVVHNTNSNTPGSGSPNWYIETLQTGATNENVIQRAWSITNDEVYFRRGTSGAWSSWRRMWNSGTFDPTGKLDSNAVAASATRLQTARTISFTGVATGSGSFDGTADLSIPTSIADSALTIAKTSGLQAALDGKLGTGSFGLGSSVSGFDWSNTQAVSRFAGGTVNSPITDTAVMGFRSALTGSPTSAFTMAGRNDRAFFQSIEGGTVGAWREIWHSGNLIPVDAGRSISAGNGLAGGGDLTADRTISLGLPGTLTGSTNNAVTGSSHTHALSASLAAWDAISPNAKANAADVWGTNAGLLIGTGSQDFGVVDNSLVSGAYQYHNVNSSGGFVQALGAVYHTRRAAGGGETQMQITETGRLAARGRGTGAWGAWQEFVPYSNVSQSNVASTVVQRSAAGDITARLLRSEHNDVATDAAYVMAQVEIGGSASNNYVRPMSMASLWAKMAPLAVAGTDVASYATTLSVKNAAIGTDQDLNGYLTTGLWNQATNANATALLNYPANLAGILQVVTAGTMTYQTYSIYNTGVTYVRTRSGGAWSAWRMLVDNAGGASFAGTVSSSQNFSSNSTNVVLAGSGGVVYLRPNGVASATGQLTVNAAGNVGVSGQITLLDSINVNSASEAGIGLNCTGGSGRNIRMVSTTAAQMGWYDATNAAWLVRVNADNSVTIPGSMSAQNITASNVMYVGSGRLEGNATELNLVGGNASSGAVRIRPQGWTTAAQTVFSYNGSVQFAGTLSTAGEYVAQGANGMRWTSGTYGAILRNDGSNFYMLFTASGDPSGPWNALRPFSVNNATGAVTMSHSVNIGGQLTAPFGVFQTAGGVAGEVLRTGNDAGIWDRDIANAIGIRGVQNNALGYVLFGSDTNGLGFNGTNLVYGGTLGLGGSAVVGGSVDFGSVTRQMINLYGSTYGIGIQGNTLYFRSGTGAVTAGGYAWYRGGVHSSSAMDPGAGGVMIGKLDGNGLWSGNDFAIFSDRRVKSKIRPLNYRGRLRPVQYRNDLTGFDDFGFIAQDVRKNYPEAVSSSLETKHLRLSMPKLVAVVSHQANMLEDQQIKHDKKIVKLTKENKQLKERFQTLEKQVKKLLARAA